MYKLLVVDDEELDRRLVRLMLSGSGQFEIVGEAKDGLEAVRKARELEPDIILMDIRMPNKNGLDAAKEIKSFLNKTKIVFLTAYDDFQYAKGAIEGKASAYLLKPIDEEELLEKLSSVAQELTAEIQQAQRMAQLMSELEANLDVIRTRFFNELLEGVWGDDELTHEYFDERLSLLRLDVLPNTVVVFKIAEVLNRQVKTSYIFFELSRYEVFNYLTDKLKTHFADNLLFSDSFGANYLAVAVPLPDAAQRKELLDLLSEVQQHIQTKYSISFSAGIGSPCQDILQIAKSYEEAMIAVTSFDSTEDAIICYEDLGEKENIISYPSYLEQQLLLSIRAGNLEKAQKLIGRFLSFFVDKTELEMGKLFASEIILKASRFLTTSRIKKLDTDEHLSLAKELAEIENWVELTAWLRTKIQGLVETVASASGTRKYKIVEKAKRYLEEHYAEDLTLDKVAGHLEISPCYFSTIFKELTGTSFSDQLMQLRMEKAKKLLEESDLNVSEVGYKVGFNDPAYFSRVFKRIVGVSPTFYRGSKFETSSETDSI